MELTEVIRRWQAGESQRAIARATGLARNTVEKYLAAAEAAGVRAAGPAPDEAVLATLVARCRPGPAAGYAAPRVAELAPYREEIAQWLQAERLQLTRIQELLAGRGVRIPHPPQADAGSSSTPDWGKRPGRRSGWRRRRRGRSPSSISASSGCCRIRRRGSGGSSGHS